MKKAIITFSDDGFGYCDPDLKEISLHELGHALGIMKHSSNEEDVMFPFKGDTKFGLSANDQARLFARYSNQPSLKRAVERFVGLTAECKSFAQSLESSPVPASEVEQLQPDDDIIDLSVSAAR